MFGLGGVVAEILGDVAFRVHPLTDVDAEELIASVKASTCCRDTAAGRPPMRARYSHCYRASRGWSRTCRRSTRSTSTLSWYATMGKARSRSTRA